jgi:poly(3-hydroxybutyrate) depolymerase
VAASAVTCNPYAVYVPSSLRAGSAAPLVVVLHGCDTTADQMAAASQYHALAESDRCSQAACLP